MTLNPKLTALMDGLSPEDQQTLLDNPDAFTQFMVGLVEKSRNRARIEADPTLLLAEPQDEEGLLLVDNLGGPAPPTPPITVGLQLAEQWGYSGSVVWMVMRAWQDDYFGPWPFSKLRNCTGQAVDWELWRGGLVFWLGQLIPGTQGRSVAEQEAIVDEQRQHCDRAHSKRRNKAIFGDACVLAKLLLAGASPEMKENGVWALTDSFDEKMRRVIIGIDA